MIFTYVIIAICTINVILALGLYEAIGRIEKQNEATTKMLKSHFSNTYDTLTILNKICDLMMEQQKEREDNV